MGTKGTQWGEKKWTDEKKETIKSLYPNFTQKQIADLLNVSLSAIKGQATANNIRKRKRGFTKEENQFILDNWNTLTKEDIGKAVGKERKAIHRQYKKLINNLI